MGSIRQIKAGRWILLLGILWAWLDPVEGAAQATVTLRFKTWAVVQKDTVCLKDIATIQGSPRSAVEKIGGVKIQNSPLPGEVLILSRQFIASRMERSGFIEVSSPARPRI